MEDTKRLVRQIEAIGSRTGHSRWESFSTFLAVSLEATKRLQAEDYHWSPELGDYEKARESFYKGFAVLLEQIHGRITYQDVIGNAYMALGVSDGKHFGQYFTPWPVARMMAQITIGTPDLSAYTQQRPMTICDPACGSGVMLLAGAAVLPRSFIDEGRAVFYGCDIDATCVKMAQLNVNLYGLAHPAGFLKPTQELTPQELGRFPEPYQEQVQQTLFDLAELEQKEKEPGRR